MPARYMVPLLALLPWSALAQAPPTPSISVRGQCTISATPDRAQLAATVLRRAPDPARAAADATQTINRFRADVSALQLPDLVLHSDGVQTAQITQTDPDGHERIQGYQGSATLTVETSAVARLAEVMRTAVQDGVDEVSPMTVFVSEALRNRLIEDCLPKAAADARAKAASLLRGLGLAPGAVLLVDNYQAQGGERPQPGPVPFARAMAFAVAAPAPTANLANGPSTIQVSTSVTFALPSGPGHR